MEQDIGKIDNSISEKRKDIRRRKLSVVQTVSSWMDEYGKRTGVAVVILALIIVCGVSLAQRMGEKETATGVMMTVANVMKDREAFSGNVFADTAITYHDMSNQNYETDQLAQIERTEKQIDAILSAKRQDQQEKAALEALTAVHSAPAEIGEYEEPVVVVSADTGASDGASAAAGATTAVFADENGQYQYLGEYLLTAYCPCPICCGIYSNMTNPTTASGTTPVAGWTIAAPSNFAFGTKLMINGQVYCVEDRGGAITGNHIDIYFNTHQEALNFGRRTASVYLVTE